jgi:hypothetical protein
LFQRPNTRSPIQYLGWYPMRSKYSVCLPMIVVYSKSWAWSRQSPPKWAFNHIMCDNDLELLLGPLLV